LEGRARLGPAEEEPAAAPRLWGGYSEECVSFGGRLVYYRSGRWLTMSLFKRGNSQL
jgi:hypothetical protein